MAHQNSEKGTSIIRPDYTPKVPVFQITPPVIETGYVYHFTTPSCLLYEVRFAAKADNLLEMVVNFSVLSDEFEYEYSVTNRGELYGIIATVIEILIRFHRTHILTTSYEFTGEFKEGENKSEASIRSRLYIRYAERILDPAWRVELSGNKVLLRKIK